MLTETQLALIHEFASDNYAVVEGDEFDEALDAARATIAAMRTPITAEALVQDGWAEVYTSSNALLLTAARRSIYATAGYPGFEVSIWEDGETELYYKTAKNCGSTLPMPANMHDLARLASLYARNGCTRAEALELIEDAERWQAERDRQTTGGTGGKGG